MGTAREFVNDFVFGSKTATAKTLTPKEGISSKLLWDSLVRLYALYRAETRRVTRGVELSTAEFKTMVDLFRKLTLIASHTDRTDIPDRVKELNAEISKIGRRTKHDRTTTTGMTKEDEGQNRNDKRFRKETRILEKNFATTDDEKKAAMAKGQCFKCGANHLARDCKNKWQA